MSELHRQLADERQHSDSCIAIKNREIEQVTRNETAVNQQLAHLQTDYSVLEQQHQQIKNQNAETIAEFKTKVH
jgi:phage shock protein A